MSLFCELSSLETESDVEQKFIFPFLTSNSPLGLGLAQSDIYTKKVLKPRVIDKGQKQKVYYPDYLIMIRGIPVLVVEAKKPGEDLLSAFSEARLYAAEINADYPHKINVCQNIIVTNGVHTYAGYHDQAEPLYKLNFDDFNAENAIFKEVLSFCSKDKLEKLANQPYKDARGRSIFNTPVSLLGGKRVQDEELVENSYGRTLVFENRSIFDPETEEDRIEIVENAYITSAKREQHIEPIYKEIRKFQLPSQIHSTPIATEDPIELVDKITQRVKGQKLAYSLMLIIGNVGSGKSTFVRYFKKMFLEKHHVDLSGRCDWTFINMNDAPNDAKEIYTWIRKQIIEQIRINHSDINFDNIGTIRKLFKQDIKAFDEGIGSLLDDKHLYDKELFDLLKDLTMNSSKVLEAYIDFLKGYLSMIPIIVLDNCDKLNRDYQLLMFEVAQWLRTEYKCLIILPMRDSTYDSYRHLPPLDTVVKDLVFRIDPPDLLRVLQKRLDYIYRIQSQNSASYELQKGATVIIQKQEQVEYFKCLMMAIRKNDWARNIFYRLSDRNTRIGIELFVDFCKSGHIDAEDIFRLRVVQNDSVELPSHKLINALLRKNRKYFNGEKSNFINVFYADRKDDFPDPFVRLDILRWLSQYTSHAKGSDGSVRTLLLITGLQAMGHSSSVIERELNYLVERGLVATEGQGAISDTNDLIKISIPGTFHLNLLNNISYLSACAEDVIYKNTLIMTRISRRLSTPDYLNRLSMIATARDMINYLLSYQSEYISRPNTCLNEEGCYLPPFNFKDCQEVISKWLEADFSLQKEIQILEAHNIGDKVNVIVSSKKGGGIVGSIKEPYNAKAFISVFGETFNLLESKYDSINIGDVLLCEIFAYDQSHKSFQVKYLETITSTLTPPVGSTLIES